jgi:xanthine dehydrogenase accessory factor
MSIFKLAADLTERGTPCAICTVIRVSGSVPRHEGSKMLVGANGELLAGTIGGGEMESRALQLARDAIHDGKPRNVSYQLTDPASGDPGVCGGTVEVFIEPLLMQPTLLVIGAGHVGRALVHLAKWSGFRVVLADDRAELVTPALAPNADVYLAGALHEQLSKIELTPQTYVALVTRGYPIDVNLLPMLLQSPTAYIGVIGSKRRWLTAKQALIERGLSESDLARVHAPIGIELNAETPEEIAVSIMAEIISIRRSR